MPITRQDAVMNLDTQQELKVNTPVSGRVTRSTIHRILKERGIKHEPGISMADGFSMPH